MKFGYLILRKISKFVANRCQIMKAKYARNAISAGAPLQTPLGELTALCRLLLDLRGLLLRKGRKGLGTGEGEESGRGKGTGAEGKGGQGNGGRERVPQAVTLSAAYAPPFHDIKYTEKCAPHVN